MASILKNKKVLFFLFSILLLFLIACSFFIFSKSSNSVNLEEGYFAFIGGNKLNIEIADNPIETYRGLSFKESLLEGNAMLFVFSGYEKRRFVMRNMNFPIDIIFIKDDVVKEIKADCPPEGSDPKIIYESADEVNMVLEVPAGYAKRNNIEAGASFKFFEK